MIERWGHCHRLFILVFLFCSASATDLRLPIDIGSRLELFVDDYLIESTEGVELRLHSPRFAEKAISFDRPWEGVTSGVVTVFKDGDLYRMYYRGDSSEPERYVVPSLLRKGEQVIPAHEEVTCYAESRDGITWTKPNLGLFEFQGSKENNIVWTEHSHAFAPFKDANPAPPSSQRYKAFGIERRDGKGTLVGFVSSDGIHWSKIRDEPLLTDGAFDSLNLAFWDPVRKHYVAIYRDFWHGVRSIKHATSRDFIRWTPGEWASFGDTPPEHLYTNAAQPYFRAPHIYLSFPMRFHPWRTFHADAPTPGLSDGVFMTSRDGVHWDRRFLEAFIRPGRDQRNWIQRTNVTAPNVVPTGPDEISLYNHRNYTSPSHYYQRLVLRTDGFVSAHADYTGGDLITKPLVFEGENLVLNYATSALGSIRIEIQDQDGHLLPGFSLQESPVIFGDQIEREVDWKRPASRTDRGPLSRLAGRPVRLRFVIKDADLYSLQFR